VARFPRGPAGWPGRMTKATTVLSGGYTELLVGQCGGAGARDKRGVVDTKFLVVFEQT
jgi:hypothetical protein